MNSPFNVRSRMGIRKRVFLLLLVVFVPILLLETFIYVRWFQESKRTEKQANLELARAVAKNFDTFIHGLVYGELAIGRALTVSRSMIDRDRNRTFDALQSDYPAVRSVFWLNSSGIVIASSLRSYIGFNLSDRSFFEKVKKGQDWAVSELIVGRATGKPAFTISRGIRNARGELLGVVAATVEPEQLDNVLGIPRSKDAGVSLLDNKGMHVFRYPRTDFTWEQRNWLKLYPIIGEALKGKEVVVEQESKITDAKRLVAFTPVSSIGWVVSCSRAETEVIAGIIKAMLPSAVLMLLVTLAAFGTATGVFRPITTSIQKLRNHAAALGRGEMEHIERGGNPGELEELAHTLNEMADRIRLREQALKDSEQRYQTTLASIGDAVIATDVAGRITFMNAVAEELTGWTLTDASQKAVLEVFNIINEQTRREVENPVAKVLREGMVVGLANHTILVKRNGTEVPIDDSGAPIRDGDGKAMGVVLVFRDITERKLAEEALRVIERRYAALFANKINGMAHCRIITDEQGRPVDYWIMEINEAYERIIGIKKADIESHRVTEVFPDIKNYAFDYIGVYGKIALEGGEIKFEEFFEATRQYLSIYAYSPLPGEFAAIFTDVTDRKRMEESLQKAHNELELRVQERTGQLQEAYTSLEIEMAERKHMEEQLRQSQKMEAIGTLAGGIAHDFNNILAAILGFTEMVIDDVPGRPDVEGNLQNVLKSAMRAKDLVKQILAFSRKTNYERAPLSLSPLVKETVQLLRASIPSTIEIKVDIATSWDHILAAPVEVQQIVMNLATNAALAMQERGGILEVGLTDIDFTPDSPVLEQDVMPGEYMQLTVKDTGVGMSPDVMKRVFEPFFTTREVGKGTGMGLAVVYGIVKDLQGTITVESTPGVGSTFRVFLPKVQAEAPKEETHTAQISGGTERILFIDDEEMLVEWGRATLERFGYKVTAMTDSKEALNTFASDPSQFDLVITDYTMPGFTGVQLAREVLKLRPDIPVILCSGHSETVSPEIAKEAGIREYLMKPLARQELAEAVRRELDEK